MFQLVRRIASIFAVVTKDKKVRQLMLGVGLLVATTVALLLGLSYWREFFISQIQAVSYKGFLKALGIFSLIAGSLVLVKGYHAFLMRKLEMRAREILYHKYMSRLAGNGTSSATPEQRVTVDLIRAPQLVFSILFGLLEASIILVTFGIAMSKVAAWFVFPAILVYAGIGMVVSARIAKPLKKLDIDNQQKEANLYRELIVWFKSGGKIPDLNPVKYNWMALATRSKVLGFFVSGHGQLGAIIPFLVLSPGYFTGVFTMGILWQVADMAGRVIDSLTYLIDRRADISEVDACIERLEQL